MNQVSKSENLTGLEIAVIGMAGRFPGARNIREFWNNLKNGVESITFFSDKELEDAGVGKELLENPNYIKALGYLERMEYFDSAFFSYPPMEAEILDPQLRLFHECAWEALEDAAYLPEDYDGLIGLYAGASDNFYWKSLLVLSGKREEVGAFEIDQMAGKDYLCARTAYKLDLKGPVVFVHTACSTSLTAIHMACQSLISGETDIALAGGVSIVPFKAGYIYQEGMIQSPDGHTRTFNRGALGTVAGNGLGIVVLKRLEEALEDCDSIYAVIKGSSINNDGAQKIGFTAPSVDGQVEALEDALNNAQVEVESIAYVEAHGTGTPLGDPIEIEALTLAYETGKKAFCGIGSVKSNIGHLDTAAGVAGFIKTVLALKHRFLPPTLHFETPNQNIDFINSPFYVNSGPAPWEQGEFPRRAAVSSLGIGGTNVHVILEEKPGAGERGGRETGNGGPRLLLLSAMTPFALEKAKGNLAGFLNGNPGVSLDDTAYTLQVGRKSFKYRWMALCDGIENAIHELSTPGGGETHMVVPGENDIPAADLDGDLNQTGRAWLRGAQIDWDEFHGDETGRRISLPTYPFEQNRYWIEGNPLKPGAEHFAHEPPPGKNPDMSQWFYTPSWKRTPSVSMETHLSRKTGRDIRLVFCDSLGIGDRIIEVLNPVNRDMVTVTMGDGFTEHETGYTVRYTMDPRKRDHYVLLFKSLERRGKSPRTILHLWGLCPRTRGTHDRTEVESFEDFLYKGFYSLIFLARAVNRLKSRGDLRITVVTAGAQDVTGDLPLQPGAAAVMGAVKVLPQEFPYIQCRAVDIVPPRPGTQPDTTLIHQLAAESDSFSTEPVTAYRGIYRWVQTFEPLPLGTPPESIPRLRENGVYLITGGLGKIGLQLARFLAARVRAGLILVGRTPLSEGKGNGRGKIAEVKALEEMGARVLTVSADISDPGQLETLVNRADAHFGVINGIFHAAGETGESMVRPVEHLDEEGCKEQFRARVYGLQALENVFRAREHDFCLVVSSLVSVLGGLGFAAYAAGMTFMDTFVHNHNQKHPVPWMSVNTAEWLFNRADPPNNAVAAETLELSMTPEEGIETFERILSHCKDNQVIISTGPLQDRIDKWVKLETLRDDGESRGTEGSFHPRPLLSRPYTAPSNSMQQTLADIWQTFLHIRPIGIEDDFFELGGDSLKAITILSRIHKKTDAAVTIEEFFQFPRINELSAFIEKAETRGGYVPVEPAEKRDYYPLSSAQRRLYLLQQIDLIGTGYNIPMVLRIGENADRDKLENTFRKVIARHASLRTSFHMVDDLPVQRIHDEVTFALTYCETRGTHHAAHGPSKPGASRPPSLEGINSGNPPNPTKVSGIIPADNPLLRGGAEGRGVSEPGKSPINKFIKPFDLSQAPLIRSALFKMPDGGHAWVIDVHHIVCDGISQTVLMEDFLALYNGDEPEPLKLQYIDFAQWQNRLFESGELKAQETYWLELYADAADIPGLQLPEDFKRPEVFSFEGDRYQFVLERDDALKFRQLGTRAGGTLFMNVLAALNVLFYKYSGSTDIVIGSGIAGRQHDDVQRTIGMFVNTLPMRNHPGGEKTYETLLKEVISRSIENFRHQDIRFEELVDKLDLPRDPSRNPLFDISMVVMNFQPDVTESEAGAVVSLEGKNKHIASTAYQNPSSRFDMTFFIYEPGEEIYMDIEYYSAVFSRETIQRLVSHFKTVVKSVINRPDGQLKDIDILSEDEKKLILQKWNRTHREYPGHKTVHALFEEHARKTPGKIAVGFEDEALTYDHLNRGADILAALLRSKGVVEEVPVGIMTHRCPDMVVGVLGILKAGGCYVPVDPKIPESRREYILKDSNAKVLLGKSSEMSGDIEVVELNNIPGNPPTQLTQPTHPTQLSYIMYTSGSTGRPKGVMIEHRGVVRLVKNTNFISFEQDDRLLVTGALGFDISTFEIWGPLLNGAGLYLAREEMLLERWGLEDRLIRYGISILHVIPQLFNRFAARAPGMFGRLRYLLVGGDRVSPAHIEMVRERCAGVKILHMYGPTENTVFSTFLPVDRAYRAGIPIGGPVAGSTVYIIGTGGELLPVGLVGEICTGGHGLARGYLNNPDLTNSKFQITNHKSSLTPYPLPLYHTGDLGRWLPDGTIQFLGRRDHQVKIRGVRIELGEIEGRLLEIGGIKEAVVVARPDGEEENALCAYFVSPAERDPAEIRETLSRVLPPALVPSYFIQLDALPLTTTGKLHRKALPGPLSEDQTRRPYMAPGDEVEAALVKIWRDVLDVEEVGIDDNFFDLGGHSLSAAALTSKIHRELGVHVQLAGIFKNQTPRALAAHIKQSEGTRYGLIAPVEKREYYPQSSAQKRVFLIQQMDLENTGYNMPFVLPLGKGIDRERFEGAFKRLIARHESLRTSFHMVDDRPVQRIHDEVNFDGCLRRLSEGQWGAPPGPPIDEFVKPFDLSQAPLIRSGLIEQPGGDFLWFTDIHHIISDGTSQTVLIEDFVSYYTDPEVPGLPDLRIQYKDFSHWQNHLFESKKIKEQEEYWLRLYPAGEDIPRLDLPADFKRPDGFTFAGDTFRFTLDREDVSTFNALGSASGGTLYMNFLTLLNVLFYKYTGVEDIIIGSGVAGRPHADLQPLIGMFVNILPMRNFPNGEKTYESFLKEVVSRSIDALNNQDVQFEHLVEKLDLKRDTSRNPLFDVTLVVQNFQRVGEEISRGLSDTEATNKNTSSKFDMTFSIYEDGEDIYIDIEYYTGLFEEETVKRLVSHLNNAVKAVIHHPGTAIKDIEIISEEEKHRLLFDFNDTFAVYPKEKTVHELFREQAEITPDRTALLFESEQLTYRCLNRRADRLAVLLRSKGVEDGVPVGIETLRRTEMVIGILGILKAGGCYVPVDPKAPEARKDYILEDSNAKVLLSNLSGNIEVVDISRIKTKDYNDFHTQPLNHSATPRSLAYIMYTSGSTGRPKGVMVEHRGVVRLVKNTNFVSLVKKDVILAVGALGFDISTFEIWLPLLNGLRLCLAAEETLLDWRSLEGCLHRFDITVLNLVPALFNTFARRSPRMFDRLRWMTLGGEVVRPGDIRGVIKGAGAPAISHMYGPTENTTFSTFFDIKKDFDVHIPIGRPVANSTVYILGRDGELLPVGVVGEICTGGHGLARGYLNNPDLTNSKFQITNHNPPAGGTSFFTPYPLPLYHTGDMGRWLPDGTIQFMGRRDHQVKVRGVRIELKEIESHLLAVEAIKEVVVLAMPDTAGELFLCAYIVPGGPIDPPELRKTLSGVLPPAMIPNHYITLEKMPLTSSGKIDGKALPAPEMDGGTGDAYTAPRDEVEAKLAAIWSDVLERNGQSAAGIDNNFFELGGHSLKAAVIVSRIHKEFQVKVSLLDVFKTQTIRGLGETIRKASGETFIEIGPVPKKEYYELSFNQKRLWIIQQMNLEDNAYNMPGMIKMGPGTIVDPELIERSVEAIIRKHESLRTGFKEIDGNAVQFIVDQFQTPFQSVDISALDGVRKQTRLKELIDDFNLTPFFLHEAPLFRSLLVKVAEEDYIFAYNMHHIVTDGWSMEILENDFHRVYGTVIPGGEAGGLHDTGTVTYKDFAHWHNRRLEITSEEDKTLSRQFWITFLKGELPPLRLPYDFPDAAGIKQKNGASHRFVIPGDIKDTLNALGKKHNLTLFTLMYTVYNIFLSTVSGRPVVVSSIVNAGRDHPSLREVVGFFVNSVIFKLETVSDEVFIDFARRVQESVLEFFGHQNYPLELVLDEVGITYPEVTASFNMINVRNNESVSLKNLEPSHQGGDGFGMQNVKFDIEAYVSEYNNGIEIRLSYNKNLFKAVNIEFLMKKYREQIEFFARAPQKQLKEYKETRIRKSFRPRGAGAL